MKRILCCLTLLPCLWACKKNHNTTSTPPPPFKKAYLAKAVNVTSQDSVVIAYNTDTSIQMISVTQVVKVPDGDLISYPGYYPYTFTIQNGLLTEIDCLGDPNGYPPHFEAYDFLYDNQNRVLEFEFLPFSLGYTVDSLVYDSQNRIVADYYANGRLNHVYGLDTRTNLTWDANGDISQLEVYDAATGIDTKTAYTYDKGVDPVNAVHAGLYMNIINRGSWLSLTAHNMLTAQTVINHTLQNYTENQSETRTYTYDSSGFPLTCTQTVTGTDGSVAIYQNRYTYTVFF